MTTTAGGVTAAGNGRNLERFVKGIFEDSCTIMSETEYNKIKAKEPIASRPSCY